MVDFTGIALLVVLLQGHIVTVVEMNATDIRVTEDLLDVTGVPLMAELQDTGKGQAGAEVVVYPAVQYAIATVGTNRSPVSRSFERPKSASLSRNRSHSVSAPPRDSRSPKNIVKDKSRRSPSGSPPRKAALVSCGNRSRLVSAPSYDSGSPKNIVKYKSRRSPSGSPHWKAALVSYDNGSPDSGRD